MLLKKIVKSLQLLLNILLFFISAWIILYAFESALPELIGTERFIFLYTWTSKTISICGALIILLAIIYAIGLFVDKKK